MVFLLEEIAVETVAIVSTLVAAACLVGVLLGFAREHRAQRAAAPSGGYVSSARDVRNADRATRQTSTFTPSHS